jgi:LmbE family N-acetylglucosaminyl deacetylase
MSTNCVLVIAPHPDDETLGCGGTLLVLKEKRYSINWLVTTSISEEMGYSRDKVNNRKKEIEIVAKEYGFDNTINLDIPTARVDEISKGVLVKKISDVFMLIKPGIILLPFYNDVHTDHKCIAEAVISCTKWFRHPFIEKVLCYETISETDFNINSTVKRFEPNVFVDISKHLETKIKIMKTYAGEMSDFPFPRSEKAIRSLAFLRGAQCGAEAAEAFELLRAIIKS